MPFIVTPGEFNRRAEFYHQMQQLTGAGLGVVRCLDQVKNTAPSGAYRRSIQHLLQLVESGHGFAESMRAVPDWMPEFDVTLIESGEKSGRMDRCFKMLGDYYVERAKVAKKVIIGLAYPAFLVHLLVLVMSIVLFFWYPAFCIFPIVGLFLLYIAVFLMIYAAQNKHPEFWRSKVEFTLNMIPVMGTARRHLAISRFSAALEALISAGVSIIEAWDMAARASGSIAIQRMVESWIPMLRAGKTPAEMLGTTGKFPSLFTNQYAAGEISGKLDETLERLRDYYQDSGGRRIQLLAQWVPIAIYVMVLIAGGVFVIWFYVTYFNKAFQAIGI